MLISLFFGALAGRLLLVHVHIYAPVLPIVATVLVVATAAFAFRGRDRRPILPELASVN